MRWFAKHVRPDDHPAFVTFLKGDLNDAYAQASAYQDDMNPPLLYWQNPDPQIETNFAGQKFIRHSSVSTPSPLFTVKREVQTLRLREPAPYIHSDPGYSRRPVESALYRGRCNTFFEQLYGRASTEFFFLDTEDEMRKKQFSNDLYNSTRDRPNRHLLKTYGDDLKGPFSIAVGQGVFSFTEEFGLAATAHRSPRPWMLQFRNTSISFLYPRLHG